MGWNPAWLDTDCAESALLLETWRLEFLSRIDRLLYDVLCSSIIDNVGHDRAALLLGPENPAGKTRYYECIGENVPAHDTDHPTDKETAVKEVCTVRLP